MSKISLNDLDKYEDEYNLEKFKKKQKVNTKKKRERILLMLSHINLYTQALDMFQKEGEFFRN